MTYFNDILVLLLACACGGLLGVLFFGGLWWTVRRGVLSPRPALWFFVSLMARMGLVLIGFYLVGGGHWQRLIACLLGFTAARIAVLQMTFRRLHPPTPEVPHAPHA